MFFASWPPVFANFSMTGCGNACSPCMMKHSIGAESDVNPYSVPHRLMERTFQGLIQKLHDIVTVTILLALALRWSKEVSCAEHKVELAVFRVNSLDFGEQLADCSCSRSHCETRVERISVLRLSPTSTKH